MDQSKIEKFMLLAGQEVSNVLDVRDERTRQLGAQLLLSELLEYIIKGLGITPVVRGQVISDPEDVTYEPSGKPTDKLEMIDGLADVAYTMYWNACAFGIPLEEAFELVCDNNLEKFVRLSNWQGGPRELANIEWDCGQDITWPKEVASVNAIKVGSEFFAVGKDARGKVRKPSTYRSVDLKKLVR